MNLERRLQTPRAVAISLMVGWRHGSVPIGTLSRWYRSNNMDQSSTSTHRRGLFLFII